MTFFHDADPLLILATILMAGSALGWAAQRVRLPSVTGQILAGILMGGAGLDLFGADAVRALEPLTYFALALIGVTVGAHLNLRRLRNAGRRLALLLVAECTITPLLVAASLFGLVDVPIALVALLGPLAISTAPATIVAVVRETRARGVFVKTLIAAVAINNIACILLFEAARSAVRVSQSAGLDFESPLDPQLVGAFVAAGGQLLSAVLVGGGAAVITHFSTLRVTNPERLATISVISIMLTFGLASWLEVSPLLAALMLGVVQTNLNPDRDRLVDSVFANFEPAILCAFFTLAGFHLSFESPGTTGLVALVFFTARALGKLVSARLAMRLADATQATRANLGMALLPQAGIAIGLVILVENDPAFAPLQPLFVAVVLSSVTLSEILGPLTTRLALVRAGEAGRDRPRLVDFLQEENITVGLRARTLREAIEPLTDFLISSHHLDHVDRKALLDSVLEREQEISTCLGGGLAVPHGVLPDGSRMVGVMGISREGMHIDTPDGLPLHCIVLLATPLGERDRHLEVLAALARRIGADPAIQQQLYNARSAAHVYEILHSEEAEDFNYFLEEEG